jgi:hypothetical protein
MVVDISIHQTIESEKDDLDFIMDKLEPAHPFTV